MDSDASVRCFIALQPDVGTRDHLAALTDRLRAALPAARPVTASNLHLTLAFIGELRWTEARQLAGRLAALPPSPVAWQITRIDGFAGARVAFAGGSEPLADDAPLRACARSSRELLQALGIRFDPKPFVPHVTLLRQVPAHAIAAIRRRLSDRERVVWHSDRMVLMASMRTDTGLQYRPIDPAPESRT